MSEAGETITVEWEQAVAVVGHHMEATPLYPERFRVRAFPTQAELAELRQFAQ